MSQQKKITSFLDTLATIIIDSVFPRRCFGCGTFGTHLCHTCLSKIPRRTPSTLFITRSRHETPGLDSLTSATFFRAPLVSRLIHNFKFQGIQELKTPLAQLLLDAIERSSIPLPDSITPVPLHPRRLKERGFNQSALLAEEIAIVLNRPVPLIHSELLLIRKKHTRPQSKLKNRNDRLTNLCDAFSSSEDLTGKNIWLIDDVTTTGTTLNECAMTLKAQGARSVHAFVVAH